MKRDDTVYLHHILDAIAKVQTYLLDTDEAPVLADPLVQDGVIRQMEIIGEATKRLSGGCAPKTRIFPGTTLPECGTSSFTITSA
jgi:uncharacterized protein with HEPN domain